MLMNVKGLPSLLGEGKKYVILDVLVRWISLAAGIAMIYAVALTMDALYSGLSGGILGLFALMAASGAMFVRYLCIRASCRFRISASMAVKEGLYDRIVRKAEALGVDVDEIDDAQLNEEDVSRTAEYYSSVLPDIIYTALAALTVFAVFCILDWKTALVLPAAAAVCLIVIHMMKKNGKQLDTMLKYVPAALYTGAALTIVTVLLELKGHAVSIYGCLMVILILAEFLLPYGQKEMNPGSVPAGRMASGRIIAFLNKEKGKDGDSE